MRYREAGISIPFDRISKIEIYKNKKPYKSLESIMIDTGADYAINGTLYNMKTMKAVCPLRLNGKTEFRGRYNYKGYSWNSQDDFELRNVPDDTRKNFIACTNILLDGNIPKMYYNPAQGGRRGRTAIGIKFVDGVKRLCLYACKDSSVARKSPEELAKLLQLSGWQNAVMLDGGGSSQAIFKNEGIEIFSSRKCAHYILIYLKGEYK